MSWGAVAAVAGSIAKEIGNSALSSYNSRKAAKRQYKYDRWLQQDQQKWEEKMSNTAHQREMADLKKAGLNPILTATGGNGASTPTFGASGVGIANPNFDSESDVFTSARKASIQEKLGTENLELQNKDIKSQIETRERESKAYEALTKAQANSAKQSERETAVNTALLNNQWNENILTSKNRVNATNSAYVTQQADNEFRSNYDRWAERVGKTGDAMMSFLPKARIDLRGRNSAKGYSQYNGRTGELEYVRRYER